MRFQQLRNATAVQAEGLARRVEIPADGELVELERPSASSRTRPRAFTGRPGLQKWLTCKLAGT